MTDDGVERRLRTLLSDRAGRVQPELSGPALRARGTATTRPVVRFTAPVLAAAAVLIVALALGTQTLAHHGGGPHRQPPGRPAPSIPASPTAPPTQLPTQRSSTPPTMAPDRHPPQISPTGTRTRVPRPPARSIQISVPTATAPALPRRQTTTDSPRASVPRSPRG